MKKTKFKSGDIIFDRGGIYPGVYRVIEIDLDGLHAVNCIDGETIICSATEQEWEQVTIMFHHLLNRDYINRLAYTIHDNNKEKGFYDSKKNIGEMLALIHSEVSEALECDRKSQFATASANYVLSIDDDDKFKDSFNRFLKDTFADELADIIIRVLDLAAYKRIQIEQHIMAKMRYNKLRPHKHGKKY